MLANQLTETIADRAATVAIPVRRLRCSFRFAGRLGLAVERAGRLDRADSDSVGFAQSPVDRASFGDTHLRAVDEERNVGRIGVAEARKSATSSRLVDCCLERPTLSGRIAERWHWPNVNASAPVAAGKSDQTCVRDVPAVIEVGQITGSDRKVVLFCDLPQST